MLLIISDSIIIVESIINFDLVVPFLCLQKLDHVFTKSFDGTVYVPQVSVGLRRGHLDAFEFGLDRLLDLCFH